VDWVAWVGGDAEGAGGRGGGGADSRGDTGGGRIHAREKKDYQILVSTSFFLVVEISLLSSVLWVVAVCSFTVCLALGIFVFNFSTPVATVLQT
jgi:hypothetical protein